MARRSINYSKRGNGLYLLIAAIFACTVLIIFNYNTVKVVTSMSAYILSESQYSKNQKEAVRHLLAYITTEDTDDYEKFLDHISVPVNTGRAIDQMTHSQPDSLIRSTFILGKQDPEDIESMMWLYNGFSNYSFLKDAVHLLREADSLVHGLVNLGEEIKKSVPFKQTVSDSVLKLNFIEEINILSVKLSQREAEFSSVMRTVGRKSSRVLFWVNTIVISIMLAVVVLFSNMLIYKLEKSRVELERTYSGLIATNDKLDNFIFATSHNLKAPINNLEGLLNLLTMIPVSSPFEKSLQDKMNASVTTLTNNINRIEELMNINSKPDVDASLIHISDLIFQILDENKEFIANANILVKTNFQVDKIIYSESGLKEILLNLLSNSIKYISQDKAGEIEISTYLKEGYFVLSFSDNGLGMDVSLHGDQIFGLFRRFHKNLSGSGVGLYLVKQIVERNSGKIKVQSEPGVGTSFEIFLRKQ